MYYFKDANINLLSNSKQENEKVKPKEGEFIPKWKFGTCLFESESSWDHEKIVSVTNQEYKFITWRKFKGCTSESQSYPALAYEKDRFSYVVKPCP